MTRDMEKIVAEFSSKIFDHRNILKFKSMLVDPEHLQVPLMVYLITSLLTLGRFSSTLVDTIPSRTSFRT